MTAGASPDWSAGGGFPQPEAVDSASRPLAAARLAGGNAAAGRQFLELAAAHGYDLSRMWAIVDRAGRGRPVRVRQACAIIPAGGRTGMVLLAGPLGEGAGEAPTGRPHDAEMPGVPTPPPDHAERVATLRAACDAVSAEQRASARRPMCVAQALPDPADAWAVAAFDAAGFMNVGTLAYLSGDVKGLTLPPENRGADRGPLGPGAAIEPGIEVRRVRSASPGTADHALLIEALERSYEGTLDCPELRGLRETADVLESHRLAGRWDPRLWWVVVQDGRGAGCVLLNRTPERQAVELVYLGLAAELRGRGLGRRLLEGSVSGLTPADGRTLTCAVDLRNGPALAVYERMGLRAIARRVAFVRRL